MKKLEIIVRSDKLDATVNAIRKVGIGGLSSWQIQGQGAEEPPLVGQYYTKSMISVVVGDDKVESLLRAIGDAACTKNKGDGKVFISDIEEIMDICSKECGHRVL